MQKGGKTKPIHKPQTQRAPGIEEKMMPKPVSLKPQPSKKLAGKVSLITGGDSGIGKAVALLFAEQGADIAISYLSEDKDAAEVKRLVEDEFRRRCLLLKGDIRKLRHCENLITKTIKEFGKLHILVNNAATHTEQKTFTAITDEQLYETFETNVISIFRITKFALPHLKKGACIINTASVTAYRGSPSLIDYASTKGAIVTFTRSLAHNLIEKGIRVNAVAPGPIWTPLIVSTFDKKKVSTFGSDVPMKRAGQPAEVATSYLFLASEDSAYITGQVLHPNGGEIVNG